VFKITSSGVANVRSNSSVVEAGAGSVAYARAANTNRGIFEDIIVRREFMLTLKMMKKI